MKSVKNKINRNTHDSIWTPLTISLRRKILNNNCRDYVVVCSWRPIRNSVKISVKESIELSL